MSLKLASTPSTTLHPRNTFNLHHNMAFEATTAVMDAAELREMILLQLDNKTLLLSQRVSKNFKAFIDNTKSIQRKLFFQLDDEVPCLRERMRMRADDIVNPLLASSWKEPGTARFRVQHGKWIYGIRCTKGEPYYRVQHRTFCIGVACRVQILAPAVSSSQGGIQESWRRMYFIAPGFVGAHSIGAPNADTGIGAMGYLETELRMEGQASDFLSAVVDWACQEIDQRRLSGESFEHSNGRHRLMSVARVD